MDGWWLCLRWEARERPPDSEVWMGGSGDVGDEGRDGIGVGGGGDVGDEGSEIWIEQGEGAARVWVGLVRPERCWIRRMWTVQIG